MDFSQLVDPSTTLGAFVISILASIVVGFFSGKTYEKNKKNSSKIKGSGNSNYQDIRINDK
ncbi:hypothetical protein BK143_09495 [Paenibacillus peoriae]|uniref:hypothetical protein n=1 Tax=Paenibacillus peoriae TaxID=59893 RepID=UPI00096DAE8A|nr:hypothetical protein [Paenibacillus peoriae]OMF72492.1 hypothetical protein BK143_09495 [Paenibacillus peoriae]